MASSSLLPYRWASLAARLPAAPSQRVERIALFDSYDRRSSGQLTVDDLRRGLIATLERVQTHPDADAVAPAAKAKGRRRRDQSEASRGAPRDRPVTGRPVTG